MWKLMDRRKLAKKLHQRIAYIFVFLNTVIWMKHIWSFYSRRTYPNTPIYLDILFNGLRKETTDNLHMYPKESEMNLI